MSNMPLGGPAYLACTITLAAADTPYNILALVKAVTGYANIAGMASMVMLLADKDNSATDGNQVLIGDANLSLTQYGYHLAPSASKSYGPFVSSQFPANNLWAESHTTNSKLHVELIAT